VRTFRLVLGLGLGVLLAAALCGCGASERLDAGDILFDKGEYAKAIEAWEASLREEPENTGLLIRIATAQVRLKRFEEAEATMLRAVAIAPKSPKVRQNLALVYLRKKDLDKALATFHQVRDLQKTYPQVNYFIGLIHEMRGDEETAVRYYVEEVNNGPSPAWDRLQAYKAKQRAAGLVSTGPSNEGVLIFCGACLAVAGAAYSLRRYLEVRAERGEKPGA